MTSQNSTPHDTDREELERQIAWWLSKLQVETVKNHRPVLITREDEEALEKTLAGLGRVINNYCQGREKAARKDELEHIAFVDPNTGGRIRTPLLQFRSTIDGLLVDWEGRHRQLSAPTQPGPTNSDNPTNSAGGVAKVGEDRVRVGGGSE